MERCTHVKTSESGSVVKMTAECRRRILEEVNEWGTGETLRCLGLALKDDPIPISEMTLNDPSSFIQYETNLTWIGLVGMMDPPREEVADAIRQCRQAGIRVIVITGDNQVTFVLFFYFALKALIFNAFFTFLLCRLQQKPSVARLVFSMKTTMI